MTEGISRRDAIMGALALATGTLVASAPDVALAANGQALTAGGLAYTSQETLIHLTSNATDQASIMSSAIFNRFGTSSNGIVYAVSGDVQNTAAAGSVGVWGKAWGTGQTGMQAESSHANGTALRVLGRTSYSRSGMGTVAKHAASRTVTVPTGVDTASKLLVTLQGNPGTGVYLRYAARTGATTFKVYLNKAATRAVKFAWMVTD
jgi:hypothetical protein